MPSQAETIQAVANGENAGEIRRPSGMAVINPDNFGIDAAVITYMKAYWYRNGRSDPRAILLRTSSGEVIRPSSSSRINHSHRLKVKRTLNGMSYQDGEPEWDEEISEAPYIPTSNSSVSGPTEHDKLLIDPATDEPFVYERRLELERNG